MYQTSKTFNIRPSQLLDIDDPYAAYCLDNAVGEFGRALEMELSRIDAKTQKKADMIAERTIRSWLDLPQRYRNPSNVTQLPSRDG